MLIRSAVFRVVRRCRRWVLVTGIGFAIGTLVNGLMAGVVALARGEFAKEWEALRMLPLALVLGFAFGALIGVIIGLAGRNPQGGEGGLDCTRLQADWWAIAGGIAGFCGGLYLAYHNQGFMARWSHRVVVDLLAGMALGGGCGGFLGAVIGEMVSPSTVADEPGENGGSSTGGGSP